MVEEFSHSPSRELFFHLLVAARRKGLEVYFKIIQNAETDSYGMQAMFAKDSTLLHKVNLGYVISISPIQTILREIDEMREGRWLP